MRQQTLLVALCLGLGLTASSPPARAQADPASLPARDSHQGLLVAADPYVAAERSKTKFGKRTPYEGGILAIDVYFRNDNDSPVRLNLDTVELRVGGRGESKQKLAAISPEDVADRTLLKKTKDPRGSRLPFPLPGGGAKSGRGKDWDEFAGALRSAAMSTAIIPPHGAAHGFFYFDIDHHFDWMSSAVLNIPDLAFMFGDKPLFFFEIDLAPAAP